MDIKEYQIRATSTDQNPEIFQAPELGESANPTKNEVIPLLGLVGEVGGLLSEYKKMLRDGAVHEQFSETLAEELGDILWYVATVATKFGLDLDQIAEANLIKTEDRWHPPDGKSKLFDADLDVSQQLPRSFSFKFTHEKIDGVDKLVLIDNKTGQKVGNPLTDNSYEDDGYRYHDIMHLAFMTHLGWSPVLRKLLRDSGYIQKKRPAVTDESDDSGRPQVIDEALVAAIYVYADNHNFLYGTKAVDWQLLRHIKQMTSKLEVKNVTTSEWNTAIISGARIWKKLIDNHGGIVTGNLEKGELTFTTLP